MRKLNKTATFEASGDEMEGQRIEEAGDIVMKEERHPKILLIPRFVDITSFPCSLMKFRPSHSLFILRDCYTIGHL